VTYSIVARDAATGELGVAVQSRSFRTGGAVPWAQAGVGAIATQSFSSRVYGVRGLELLAAGVAPDEALETLRAEDPRREYRQVAFLDASGRTAAHTGDACIPAHAIVAGDGYSAQGNMLGSEAVVEAIARGFEAAGGTLAERLLAALDAGEAAGGDFRGREAGAILVAPAEPNPLDPYAPISDVRVDNHPDPLGELRRLLGLELALRALRSAAPDELAGAAEQARAAGVDDDVVRWSVAVALVPHDPERAAAELAPLGDERWPRALEAARSFVETL
jgi:uncharacterized Ntn-hydrolase superfamily protein